MTSRHVALWIDHHEARLFQISREGFDESTIHAPHQRIHRHPRGSEGSKSHSDDAHRFFHDVTQVLASAEEILVLGPSTAKLEFIRYAQKHAEPMCACITGIETVDHPTDPQIAAYAKRYFEAADRMR
jgi:stalled ribosome rescue protein Dom34